jgi:small subunit ribosomal protein S3
MIQRLDAIEEDEMKKMQERRGDSRSRGRGANDPRGAKRRRRPAKKA